MESKSIVIHKGGKEEKYKLYVEDYVLSYLKYETGSLECSEIYFYGTRQSGEKKYIIYGAGRDKQIPVFDTYDLLEEIMCRLTQAGPVFMVREPEEIYQIKGYDIFYQDNQAMQSYMVERQRHFNKPQTTKKQDKQGSAGMPSMPGKIETKPVHSHGVMSAQLGMILIILVAIVINSANSYDKMEQLNQSAEEVFFAIENQEADDSVADGYEPEEDVVVEREKNQEEDAKDDQGNDQKNEDDRDAGNVTETEQPKDDTPGQEQPESDKSDGYEPEEDVVVEREKNQEEDAKDDQGNDQKNEDDRDAGNVTETEQPKDDTPGQEQPESDKSDGDAVEGLLKDVNVQKADSEDLKEESEANEGDQTEALSRNVTRYYKVEKGDTLYTICQKIYGDISQVEKICELNDISDPDRIRSGQKIILP